MKHLKLFVALFAMLALGVGNAWAVEVTMTAGTNGSECTVNGINGIKVGTSKKGGNMTITVPAGATSLQLYAAAWNGVDGLSINITPESNVNPTSISLTADAGIANNSPFTLKGDEESFKHEVTLSNITSETVLTLTSSMDKRFVVWGATCTVAGGENPGEGGGDEPADVIVKTLKSIAVGGMTTDYETGDIFKFDGTCTATYGVTKNNVPQEDETKVVTPTSVSEPDMLTAGEKEVTVTYTEDEETVTATYTINVTENVITAGTYDIVPNNAFWGTSFTGVNANATETLYGKQDDISILHTRQGNNLYVNDFQTRVYTDHYMQISVPAGYVITAIAFTADGNNWAGEHTADVGTMTDSKNWTGPANAVTITFGGKCFINKITVTYAEAGETPDGPTTALENIAVEGKAVKAIVNGQLIIIKNGVQYNAQGQVIK